MPNDATATFKRLQVAFRDLPKELKDDPAHRKLLREKAMKAATTEVSKIPQDTYHAAQGSMNKVGILVPWANQYGFGVTWKGAQVAFLEYGTGAEGVGKYKGEQPPEYVQREYGHSKGQYWGVEYAKKKYVSTKGWVGYAPMYKTAETLKSEALTSAIAESVRQSVTRIIKGKLG